MEKEEATNHINNFRLKYILTPIKFSMKINRVNDKITIIYDGEEEDEEEFLNFQDYIDSLSHYYRNQIDVGQEKSEKIFLCNKFLDTIQKYKLDLRGAFKDKAAFKDTIELYKEQFLYYKQRFNEEDEPKISSMVVEQDNFTLKQQILILHYLGVIQTLNDNTDVIKNKISIICALLGKDKDNTEKALRYVEVPDTAKGREAVKTSNNLKKIYDLFFECGLVDITKNVEIDLEKVTLVQNKNTAIANENKNE